MFTYHDVYLPSVCSRWLNGCCRQDGNVTRRNVGCRSRDDRLRVIKRRVVVVVIVRMRRDVLRSRIGRGVVVVVRREVLRNLVGRTVGVASVVTSFMSLVTSLVAFESVAIASGVVSPKSIVTLPS